VVNEQNEKILEHLSQFEIHIDEYRSSLNTEGVWLFLATLGCWSVSQPLIQLYALAVTFILCTYRIYEKMQDKRTFASITKSIDNEILSNLEADSDTQKARLLDLHNINSKKLSTANHVKSTLVFLLCYSFLAVTLINWIFVHGMQNN
jgi:hypothetical protein